MNVPHMKQQWNSVFAQLMFAEAAVSQPQLCGQLINFYGLLCRWVLSVAAGVPLSNVNMESIQLLSSAKQPTVNAEVVNAEAEPKFVTLPLPATVNRTFASLPEFFVEDMLDYYMFLAEHAPERIDGHPDALNALLTMVVALLQR